MICGLCFPLFLLVCFVCRHEIFVPRVLSLQSLTLGTRSVLCSFLFNLVSDTEHKCSIVVYLNTMESVFSLHHFFTIAVM